MHKDSANLGRVHRWIQPRCLAIRTMIASEQCLTMAPTSTSHDDAFLAHGFGDKVCPIPDQLSIKSERMAQCAFDLFGRVVIFLENAYRKLDEISENGNVRFCGCANRERGIRPHTLKPWDRRQTHSRFRVPSVNASDSTGQTRYTDAIAQSNCRSLACRYPRAVSRLFPELFSSKPDGQCLRSEIGGDLPP